MVRSEVQSVQTQDTFSLNFNAAAVSRIAADYTDLVSTSDNFSKPVQSLFYNEERRELIYIFNKALRSVAPVQTYIPQTFEQLNRMLVYLYSI